MQSTSTSPRLDMFDTGYRSAMYPVVGPEGNLWCGGKHTRGLLRIRHLAAASPEFRTFAAVSLPDTPILGPDRNLWFGTYETEGPAVVRVRGDFSGDAQLDVFDSGKANPIFPVLSGGALWFGSGSASDPTVLRIAFRSGEPRFDVLDVGVPRPVKGIDDGCGGVWFGNADSSSPPSTKLIRIRQPHAASPKIETFDSGLPAPQFSCRDHLGNLWFGSYGTSCVVRVSDPGGAPRFRRFTTPIASPSTPLAVGASVWFGTRDSAATSTRVARASGDLAGTPRFESWDAGIATPQFPLLDSKGALWFGGGTTTLATRITDPGGASPGVGTLDVGVVTPSAPMEDPHGQVWFGNLTDALDNRYMARLQL